MIKWSSKTLLALVALSLPFLMMAGNISNVIIFGDSLSDGGNLPEISQQFVDPSQPKAVSNTDPQYYVPITNPNNTRTSSATPPSLGLTKTYNWPVDNEQYLAPQAPIAGHNRSFHSISWPQFFLSYAKQDNKASSPFIMPSYLLSSRTDLNASVNYSWGYALSLAGKTPDCADEHYQAIKTPCTNASINAARAKFVANPTAANRALLEIPDVEMQVNLFLNDLKNQKVAVDNKSVYAFWVGGNDLIVANNKMHKGNLSGILAFMFGGPVAHTIDGIKTLLTALPKEKRPSNVYIVNMTNPEITPSYYGTKLAKLGKFLVQSYNFFMNLKVNAANKQSLFANTKIVVVPAYAWYQQASTNDYYKDHMGQACQINGGDYGSADSVPANNCQGFMYWNGIHPAAPLHMDLAYQFEQAVINNKTFTHVLGKNAIQMQKQRVKAIYTLLNHPQ